MAGDPAHHHAAVSKYLEASHDKIFENNRKWVDEMKKDDPAFFDKLSAGQTPEYL
jgi:carbonic anhydrase